MMYHMDDTFNKSKNLRLWAEILSTDPIDETFDLKIKSYFLNMLYNGIHNINKILRNQNVLFKNWSKI
jgi:hypothetical protein